MSLFKLVETAATNCGGEQQSVPGGIDSPACFPPPLVTIRGSSAALIREAFPRLRSVGALPADTSAPTEMVEGLRFNRDSMMAYLTQDSGGIDEPFWTSQLQVPQTSDYSIQADSTSHLGIGIAHQAQIDYNNAAVMPHYCGQSDSSGTSFFLTDSHCMEWAVQYPDQAREVMMHFCSLPHNHNAPQCACIRYAFNSNPMVQAVRGLMSHETEVACWYDACTSSGSDGVQRLIPPAFKTAVCSKEVTCRNLIFNASAGGEGNSQAVAQTLQQQLSCADTMQAGCQKGQCKNGGICAFGVCHCPPGWVGRYCSLPASSPWQQTAMSTGLPMVAAVCSVACVLVLLIFLTVVVVSKKQRAQQELPASH